jgi:hypothetical protein
MSEENVELVRGLWEQFKGVDVTAIDWDDEAIREMIARFYSPEVELRWWEIGWSSRTGSGASEAPAASRSRAYYTHVSEIRDNQIARVDEYDTLEEALKAAGLSE